MNHPPRLEQQQNDIQACMASGFKRLRVSRFLLLTIADAALARQWLQALAASGLVQSVADVARERPSRIAAVAFSHAGLQALGLAESEDHPFPSAFRSGMGSALRQDLIRDRPRDAWCWSDHSDALSGRTEGILAHILVGLWWQEGSDPALPEMPAGAFEKHVVPGCPSFFPEGKDFLQEPFGFRDGLSQPVIRHLKPERESSAGAVAQRASATPRDPDHEIAPGEFILGYRNEYDELAYCPDLQAWSDSAPQPHPRFTLNGSYLAVREIEQDVERYQRHFGTPAAADCPSIGERMMGRRIDGRPLSCPQGATDPGNSFRYRVDDAEGFVTPPGSHVRRSNPRDALGHDVASGILSSKLHRLLRRGRPFRREDGKVGMFFIACNSDLERQFEFVHQRWMRNLRFAGLEGQEDPLVGSAGDGSLSLPALPAGERLSFESLTKTVGGGYFFLPGLRALHYVCGYRASAG